MGAAANNCCDSSGRKDDYSDSGNKPSSLFSQSPRAYPNASNQFTPMDGSSKSPGLKLNQSIDLDPSE